MALLIGLRDGVSILDLLAPAFAIEYIGVREAVCRIYMLCCFPVVRYRRNFPSAGVVGIAGRDRLAVSARRCRQALGCDSALTIITVGKAFRRSVFHVHLGCEPSKSIIGVLLETVGDVVDLDLFADFPVCGVIHGGGLRFHSVGDICRYFSPAAAGKLIRLIGHSGDDCIAFLFRFRSQISFAVIGHESHPSFHKVFLSCDVPVCIVAVLHVLYDVIVTVTLCFFGYQIIYVGVFRIGVGRLDAFFARFCQCFPFLSVRGGLGLGCLFSSDNGSILQAVACCRAAGLREQAVQISILFRDLLISLSEASALRYAGRSVVDAGKGGDVLFGMQKSRVKIACDLSRCGDPS